ncbi:MAG: hypothetical protein ACUVQR_01215 [Thermogutta sp.]
MHDTHFQTAARTSVLNIMALIFFSAAIGLAICSSSGYAEPVAGGVPAERIAQWTKQLPPQPIGVGVPLSRRDIWDALARDSAFRKVIAEAEEELTRPIAEVPDELYLDFSKTGNRRRYEARLSTRRHRMATLALAECLENRGRFLAELEKTIAAICQEKTWVMPAHDRRLDNFYGRTVEIDLGAAGTAWNMATLDFWLAEKLSPECRRLIATELERRIFTPFEQSVNTGNPRLGWLTVTNNWNAVCLAGVTGAALENIPSAERRGFFVAAAEKYIQYFLQGFTSDGYCSEGIGYWNYGFGHFTFLGETLLQATGGKLDFFALPGVKQIALFGYRMEIAPGIYPAFADCSVGSRPGAALSAYLSRRFDLGLKDLEKQYAGVGAGPSSFLPEVALYVHPNSLSSRSVSDTRRRHEIRDWFSDAGILICRPADLSPDKLAVALKGGHNAEHHNHNDVGCFVVALAGETPLLDPGAEVYTARTFSGRRYESKVLNSYGHPVPVVAGRLQQSGSQARAKVLETQFSDGVDLYRIDITSAYPVPELKSLVREFRYERQGRGRLIITDQVEMSSPQEFEEAVITYSPWKRLGDAVWIVGEGRSAVRVQITMDGHTFVSSEEQIDEDVRYPTKPVRLGAKLAAPIAAGTIEIRIEPVEN